MTIFYQIIFCFTVYSSNYVPKTCKIIGIKILIFSRFVSQIILCGLLIEKGLCRYLKMFSKACRHFCGIVNNDI